MRGLCGGQPSLLEVLPGTASGDGRAPDRSHIGNPGPWSAGGSEQGVPEPRAVADTADRAGKARTHRTRRMLFRIKHFPCRFLKYVDKPTWPKSSEALL